MAPLKVVLVLPRCSLLCKSASPHSTWLGHQAGWGREETSTEGRFSSHLRTNLIQKYKKHHPYTSIMWINLKNPWSSSRHMLSKLVGDPRAKSSGRLDTITFASPGFDPVTGVMLLQDSSLAAIMNRTDPHCGCL